MHSKLFIESYFCLTSTARNPEEFWDALCSGKNGIQSAPLASWPEKVKAYWANQSYAPISCLMERPQKSYLENLSDFLSEVGTTCLLDKKAEKWGIILATTKGATEDYVWNDQNSELSVDPLNEVLEKTISKLPKLPWILTQVVSNSCASSHAAMTLGKTWIDSGATDKVLVLAGDLIGPFIHTGFQTLKALSTSSGKPFQENRDGLVLGEAITGILLGKTESEIELLDAHIFNEAHAVTAPSAEGRGILTCIKKMCPQRVPDFAIAHGTATTLNDQTEDHVWSEVEKICKKNFPITGTKWSVGHTLGASGSLDVIAAILSLKHQTVFPLPAGEYSKNLKASHYVTGKPLTGNYSTALVSSLGFGGTNGALMLGRGSTCN